MHSAFQLVHPPTHRSHQLIHSLTHQCSTSARPSANTPEPSIDLLTHSLTHSLTNAAPQLTASSSQFTDSSRVCVQSRLPWTLVAVVSVPGILLSLTSSSKRLVCATTPALIAVTLITTCLVILVSPRTQPLTLTVPLTHSLTHTN